MSDLSVITITFNDHEGLKNTMESLPVGSFEWIVVDGSSDEKVRLKNKDLLRKLQVRLIQEPDKGRFDAMNKGLRMASRDLVCFLNGGDSFKSLEVIRKVSDSYQENKWVWSVGETSAVNLQGIKQWSWPMPTHNSIKLKLGINSYCHQATFVEKSTLLEIGGFDEDSLYSDWITSLVLSRTSKPFLLGFETTKFLTEGVSSQQTIEYWRQESIKLRNRHNLVLWKIKILDRLMQNLASTFIASTRGRLIRPDLVNKYP